MPDLSSGQSVTLTLDYDDVVTVVGNAFVTATPTGGSAVSSNLTGVQRVGPFKSSSTSVTIRAQSDLSYTTTDDAQAMFPVTASGDALIVNGAARYNSRAYRNEALVKPYGVTPSFNKSTGLSTSDQTTCVKMEMEASFNAVRLVWENSGTQSLVSRKAVIGVTEDNGTSTSAKLGATIIGGSTYQVLAGATDQNGQRAVTWGGAATTTLGASTTATVVSVSDQIPIRSVPRADGGSRPLLFWKYYNNGSTNGNWAFFSLNAAAASTTAANRGRTVIASSNFGDAIANLTLTLSATTTVSSVYPIVRFDVPVCSVWSVGDSTDSCSGLVTDTVSSWVARVCNDLSTPARPVVHANFGVPSMTSADFWEHAKSFLAAGVPPPSVLIVDVASINEFGATPNVRQMETTKNVAMDVLSTARQYGIPFVIWRGTLPNENIATAPLDALRKQNNAELQALAASHGVMWLDFSALGDGASPERYVPAYKFDNIHPNETAIESAMAPQLAAILRRVVV